MIPEEAVKAAAGAIDQADRRPLSSGEEWATVLARAALEAAFPHGRRRVARTIGTLPSQDGAIVLTADGKVMVRANGRWESPGSQAWWSPMVNWLPSEVLIEGLPKHSMHAPGEWFYACEACSGLPDGDRQ